MRLFSAFLSLFLALPVLGQVRSVPALSYRAAVEVQLDADRLYAGLAAIHQQDLKGAAPELLKADKQALVADLKGALSQLPQGPEKTWPEVSARIKELKAERTKLEAEGASGAASRSKVHAELARLQLQAAFLQLSGEAPLNSKALRRNAALWSLVGAYNSAAAGKADAVWADGSAVNEELFGDGETVVVSRRWRNVASELELIARAARNGRAELAAEQLEELASFLRRAPAGESQLERHREASDALEAAARLARAGKGAEASAAALAVKDLLPHPKVADHVSVSYDAKDKAQRAQLHALESIKKDHATVLAHEAVAAKWSLTLAAPQVTKKDLKAARAALEEVRKWAKRGFVAAKQATVQSLDAAIAALDAGAPKLAARHAGWAADELSGRRTELERTARGILRRLSRLFGA